MSKAKQKEGPTQREELDNLKARLGAVEDAVEEKKPEPEPEKAQPERFVYVCVHDVEIRQKFGSTYDYKKCSAGAGGGVDSATVIESVGGPLPDYLTTGFRPNGRKVPVKFRRTSDPSLLVKAEAVYLG